MFWTLSRTSLKLFKVVVLSKHSLSPWISSFSISPVFVVTLYFHDVRSTNGLQQLLLGKKTVAGWKFVMWVQVSTDSTSGCSLLDKIVQFLSDVDITTAKGSSSPDTVLTIAASEKVLEIPAAAKHLIMVSFSTLDQAVPSHLMACSTSNVLATSVAQLWSVVIVITWRSSNFL